MIFCLVFTAPAKWRIELRAKIGQYRNRCFREEAERRQAGQNPGIHAEADGQYNIPLWSATDRTPRQPNTDVLRELH